MLANYEKLITTLKKCLTSQVREGEKQLDRLFMDDLQKLSLLQHCLKDFTLENSIHILAASYINQLFTSHLAEYTQQFCIKYFTNLLIDPAIDMSNKKQISKSLMYCIEGCDTQYLTQWKQLTMKLLLNEELYENGLLLLTAFSSAQIKDNIIQELDEKGFEFTMSILYNKYNTLSNIREIIFILEAWQIVIQYLLNYFQKVSKQVLKKLSQSQNLCKCLIHIYCNYSTGNQKHYLYLDDFNIDNSILVNQMKYHALQLHYLLLNQAINHGRYCALYVFTGTKINIYVNTLCFLAIHQNLIDQYHLELLVISMLKILKCMIEDSPLILSSSWKQMIHYVLFPFLCISQTELIYFEQDTSNYVEINDDCCLKQQMGVLKTQAANLLQKIVDVSDQIQSNNKQIISIQVTNKCNYTVIGQYIINFAIASIKHNLNIKQFQYNDLMYTFDVLQSAPILPIQASFLILSIFSYCLTQYKKQLQQIKQILSNQKIIYLPSLQRARIYTFLAYNYDQIFEECSVNVFQNLINLAFKQTSHPTVIYCALDFISNSLHKIYNQQRVILIINKIVYNQCNNFWMLLKKLVQTFCLQFSQEILILLINLSYKRIYQQIQKISKQKIKITNIISHLLHIIYIICEKGQYISNKPQIKQLLWQSNKLYPIALINYFEDNIIKIINCFLYYASQYQIECQQIHQYLGEFICQFEKSEYEQMQYFIALNCFVMKGQFEYSVKPVFQVVKRGLIALLESKQKKSQSHNKKLAIAHSLILLQNILALHGGKFAIQQFSQLQIAMECLYPKEGKTKNKLVIYDRMLLGKVLNLQFLLNLYYENSQIIKKIKKYNQMKIFYGYDISVLISCIKIQLLKQKILTNIIDLLTMSINIINHFVDIQIQLKIHNIDLQQKKLKKQQNENTKIDEEQNQQVKKLKKKKNQLIIRIKKSNQQQKILVFISTPFLVQQQKIFGVRHGCKNVQDIKNQFISLLNQLRISNPALFQSILMSFDQETKHKLKVITQCQITQILNGNMLQLDAFGKHRKKYRVLRVKQSKVDEKNINELNEDEQILRRNKIRINYGDEEGEQNMEINKKKNAQKKRRAKQKYEEEFEQE